MGRALNKGSVSAIYPKWLDCSVDEGSSSLVLWPLSESDDLAASPHHSVKNSDLPSTESSWCGSFQSKPRQPLPPNLESGRAILLGQGGEKQQVTPCCSDLGNPSSKAHRPPSAQRAIPRHHKITVSISTEGAIHAGDCCLFYAKDTLSDTNI